jgi:Tol biopolymer transport system component
MKATHSIRDVVCCFQNIEYGAVSSDTSIVAVTGSFKAVRGLWLVKVDTGEVTKAVEGSFNVLAWSPDRQTIAVAVATDSGDAIRMVRVV